MNTVNNRIPLWDNYKLLLILLVVIGHFAESGGEPHLYRSVFLFIYSFHMPAFFFVSGLFHQNKDIPNKVVSYLALYLLMKAILFIERLLLGQSPSFSLLSESGIPWFMFAMAAFVLLTKLFRNVNSKAVLLLSIIAACFAGYDKSIGDAFVLSRIIVFYPFYFAGTIIPQGKLIALRHRQMARPAALALLLAWTAACLFFLDKVYILRPLFTGRNAFSEVFLPFGPLWRLLCYAISSVLILSFFLLVPEKEHRPFTQLGSRTLQVYFWHRMILYIFAAFGLPGIFRTSYLLQIAYLGLGVVTAFILMLRPFGLLPDSVLKLCRQSKKEG